MKGKTTVYLNAIIVEDRTVIREGLRDNLRKSQQFRAKSAGDMTRVALLLREHQYDCGIIDLEIEGSMSGLGVVEELRTLNPHAYIEVITGHQEEADNALRCGADLIVEKPFNKQGYLERVARGIVTKRVKRIQDQFELEAMSVDIPFAVTHGQWASLVAAVDNTYENLVSLQESFATKELEHELFQNIAHKILSDVLCRYDAACDSPTIDVMSIGDEVQTDKDYLAFETLLQDVDIKRKYAGQFVAIVKGEVVGYNVDFQTLVNYVVENFPNADMYIDQIYP